ncbi:hypothetical protein DYB32_000069 [Aphanomyces invadans]|uniref:Uncharacterized protein n=1 Tax=Aphanomyces invadans TaxID=157072 RepID=A0A418BB40_9STRA|nr:hypothetical protein DYB32_000069 [Aphanomyces invadans]
MHPRPQREEISAVERAQVDHIVFDDEDDDREPTKTRTELRLSRRQGDLMQLQSAYRNAPSNNNLEGVEKQPAKLSKAEKAQMQKERCGRTRTSILVERAQERVKINQIYQALLAQDPAVSDMDRRTAASEWWKREPGYVEDPSAMLAASHRLRKSTSQGLKFDGSKSRTVEDLMDKRSKASEFPDKITQTPYRPSTAGARVRRNVKWTNAIIQFSKHSTENTELMDKVHPSTARCAIVIVRHAVRSEVQGAARQ